MDNRYYVYMHENIKNHKKYIGITKDINRRWSYNGIEYKKQAFGNAINKYGWDGFVHSILYCNLSKEDACQKEIELIAFYNSANDKFGYNISLGGDGVNRPLKPIYHYDMDGNYITCYENIYEIIEKYPNFKYKNIYACCNGDRLSSYNYRWFYEYKGGKIEKLKSAMERTIDGESIPLYQYSLKGSFIKKYKSRQEVLELTGIDPQFCIRGLTKTAGDYQWFNKYQGEKVNPVLSSSEKLGIRQSKKVYLYDLNYNLIKIFNKCNDVCEYFNTYHKKIKNVIDNQQIFENYYLSYKLL